MIKFNASINEKLYEKKYPFQDITFEFIIRRIKNYFNLNNTSGIYYCCINDNGSIYSMELGERISFATTIVLTQIEVFLLILSELQILNQTVILY